MSYVKIEDTLKDVGGSVYDDYWQQNGFKQFYKTFRKGVDLPKSYLVIADNSKKITQRYHLRGFQFGNWLTNEDRFNYLAAFFVCAYDLNKVLKFKNNNIGLDGALGISFGSRGRSTAAAHFESLTNIINITRYKKVIKHPLTGRKVNVPKIKRFKFTGGVGAIAHEYGHFLDYEFGSKFETDNNYYALTNGRSIDRNPITYNNSKKMRNIVEEILSKAYWKDYSKKIKSNYIKRLEKVTDKDYFFRRNEIFARLFEQYIAYKLLKIGINNSFLVQTKYNENIYMKNSELKEIVPLFDKLIREMRTYF